MIVAREPENQGDAEEQGHDNTTAEEPVQSSPPQKQSPPPAQPQGVYFPMSLLQEALDACAALTRHVEHLEHDKVAQNLEIIKLKTRVKKLERANKVKTMKLRRLRKIRTSQRIESSDDTLMDDMSNQGRVINESDKDEVLNMQEDEPKIQEAVKVVTTAKLITEVVVAVSETVRATAVVQADVPAAPVNAAAVVTTTALFKVAVLSTRRRRGVVIRDPEEESSAKTPTETKSKDKGKGMSYDDIRPIFEAKFNANLEFLLKSKEQIEEEESKAIALINETSAQKVTKRRRLNKEAEDVEELKHHLEIVPDEDDDVYIKATPLARKVPVVDYQIIRVNNKPQYKIIHVDDTHQLYRSFITMVKNFDREDLETLWNIVKERFSTSKPNNFSNKYLLSTLKTMFGRLDRQDNVWKDQRSVHGQALVKSWKLLTSCRVHIISFTNTQIILLVERRYP
nr:hypothetical protein [Tanacetum cinerariifolium]